MKTRVLGLAVLAGIVGWASVPASAAGVPQTLTHQGRLYDANSMPIASTLPVKFALYADALTMTSLWTETDMITFDEGYFSVSLGQATPFPAGTFSGAVLFLGITVGTDPEMTPRAPVQSVPYAMVAGDAIGDIHPTSVSIGNTQVIDSNGKWVGSPSGMQGPAGPAGPTGPQGATGPSGIANCTWVHSAGCTIGAAAGSTCVDSVTCPAGDTVFSGGCTGYTTMAIGNNSPNGTTGWNCWSDRITAIANTDLVYTYALCCH